jgi:CHAT domain/Tetratricopeptide repeat
MGPDREAALAALYEHLLCAAGQPERILDPAAADAARALQAIADADSGTGVEVAVIRALGFYHWLRHEALPPGRNEADLDAAVRHLTLVYLMDPAAVPEALRRVFEGNTTAAPDASEALNPGQATEAAQTAAADLSPSLAIHRGINLFHAYRRTGERGLLDESVALIRAAVAATPAPDPDRPGRLSSLGIVLRVLYESTGEPAVLLEAVDVGRAAVAATPAADADRAVILSNLVGALQTLYRRTGELDTLLEAVDVGRSAAAAAPADHAGRVATLSNLGVVLRSLFERTGQVAVMVEAVEHGRAALAAAGAEHADRASVLTNLGLALRSLFERTGESALAAEAVETSRKAVEATAVGHPDRPGNLSNLGLALRVLAECTGQPALLAEAVDTGRAAMAMIAADHPERAAIADNLGVTLRVSAERTGDRATLTEAAQVGRAAVQATAADHPDRAGCLGNLGNTLRVLFEHGGELEVLLEAVESGRAAAAATAAGHPEHAGRLSNLGGALQLLFERSGQPEVLVEAVGFGRAAVAATPGDHPERAGRLSNLAIALRVLSEHTGAPQTLAEAVQVGRAAVAATPVDRPEHAVNLGNLVGALVLQYEQNTDSTVLLEAVAAGRAAVAATPVDHPERAGRLCGLGDALGHLHSLTKQRAVLEEARACHREAAQSVTGATIFRIHAYRQLAQSSVDVCDPLGGLQAMEAAVDLVDSLAPAGSARADREFQLGRLTNLPGEAAAAALAAGRPNRAVELLERTRGVLAADVLGLRDDDLARLREHAPNLTERLDELHHRLDVLDRRRITPQSAERLADERRTARADWQQLLDEIHGLPDFAGYHRAPQISVLARQAKDGPVVFVTTSPARCDALILTDGPEPVQCVPLTGLTHHDAYDHARRLLSDRGVSGGRDLHPDEPASGNLELLTVLAWLWDVIAEPVLARLGRTATPAQGESWPRVWWCPVGVLAFLPLHAAGHYSAQPDAPVDRQVDCQRADGDGPADETAADPPRCVPDCVVSSYTPTVRALARSRAGTRSDAPPLEGGASISSTVIVPVPDAPGTQPLHGVTEETAEIRALIPTARLLDQPTRTVVLEALPRHRIAHFACHGEADWAKPARSRLILTDHATAPLAVDDITALNLTADLAFLSACSTGVTAPRLVDEALHITGAFHLAGYRHVIGTLWPIDDRTAAQLAADFYARLTDDGAIAPQTERSAAALHQTVRHLRDQYPGTPELWAAHTHTGA